MVHPSNRRNHPEVEDGEEGEGLVAPEHGRGRERSAALLGYSSSSSSSAPSPHPRAAVGHFHFPFWVNFVAGGVALPLSFAAVHPLDVLKTRLQAAAVGERQKVWDGFRNAGSRLVTRGFASSVVGAGPQGALRLGTYGWMRGRLEDAGWGTASPMAASAAAAVVADFASSGVKVPREVITQRQQAGLYDVPAVRCMSALTVARQVVQEDGFKGLLRGYWATAARDVPFMVLLFTSYEQFGRWKFRLTTKDDRHRLFRSSSASLDFEDPPWDDWETALWGGVSGSIAAFCTTPFDVIKTRIVLDDAKEREGGKGRFSRVLRTVLQEGGMKSLFVGGGARSAWWFAVCSVFFFSYERLRCWMGGWRSPDSARHRRL